MAIDFIKTIECKDGLVIGEIFAMENGMRRDRCGLEFWSSPFMSVEKRLIAANKWADKEIDVLRKHAVYRETSPV